MDTLNPGLIEQHKRVYQFPTAPDEGKFTSEAGLIKNNAAIEISELLIIALLIGVFLTIILLA